MSPKLKLSKSDFQRQGLPDLLFNIWGYADAEAKKYEIWCVETAPKKMEGRIFRFEIRY